MGYQSKTYSLSDEVVRRIEIFAEYYGSPNKALSAILPKSLGGVEGVVPAPSRFNQPQLNVIELPEGVTVGMPPKSGAAFSCQCIHNDVHYQGRKFMSERRGATICPDCVEGGHRGEPRDCKECAMGEGTGAL